MKGIYQGNRQKSNPISSSDTELKTDTKTLIQFYLTAHRGGNDNWNKSFPKT